MRLFIAFDVSDEAKEEAMRLQDTLKKTDSNLNLVKKFHLTLKFLGEVDEEKAEEVKNRLGKIRFEKFPAELDGIGVFPSEDYIRVVWIGLEPKDKIVALQQQVEESLKGMFATDKRFHPHLTLARVKTIRDKKGFIEALKRMEPEKIRFDVGSFSLIRSTLTPDGPVYEELYSVESN